jgi:hypothetical protein
MNEALIQNQKQRDRETERGRDSAGLFFHQAKRIATFDV